MKTLATYTTTQLVEFFNANCEAIGAKPVKKFADRKTAERRCAAVAAATPKVSDIQRAFTRSEPARKSSRIPTTSHVSRSGAIAASWADPATAAARAARHHVKVAGATYRSFAQACREIGLDLNGHITARGAMVRDGAVTFQGHTFRRVAAE